MNKLEEQIREVIKKNLLWIEENLVENIIVSHGELGCEIGLLSHLESYSEEFTKEIMEVLKENLPEKMCEYYDCSFFEE